MDTRNRNAALLHHLPFSRASLLELLCAAFPAEAEALRRFSALLTAHYHARFHARLETLKRAYAPFNPDAADTNLPPDAKTFLTTLEAVLRDGNYVEIPEAEVHRSVLGEGIFPVSCEVDFHALELARVFALGESHDVLRTRSLGMVERELRFDTYRMVFMLLRFRPPVEPTTTLGRLWQRLWPTRTGVPGKLYLKLLKNVPKADLEILFPNPRPRMKPLHKLKIAIPLVTGVGILVHQWVVGPMLRGESPLSGSMSATLFAVVVALAGYIYKTWSNYRAQVREFLSEITHSLYFRSLATNAGVFHVLNDAAEEEESKEALLAYHFLRVSGASTEKALDEAVQDWLADHGYSVDFESDDALRKLKELFLIRTDEKGHCSAVAMVDAIRTLEDAWRRSIASG
ncbi:MAG: TMEM143 family protein [Myxococcota bacterium]